jgi:DNA-binding protein YbaB
MERPNWGALHDMVGDIERTIGNLDSIQQRMMKLTGEAWSEDRMIRAVVGPRGEIVDLEIDARVFRKPNSRALAAAIIKAVKLAGEDAARQVQELLTETMPADLRPGKVDGLDFTKLVGGHDADVTKGAADG